MGLIPDLYAQPDSSLDLGDYALVFTGSMGYRPNVDAALWFADQVLGQNPRASARSPLFYRGQPARTPV